MTNHSVKTADRRTTARRVDTIVWGVLLLWIGVSLLASFGWGISLLGVGIILVGDQLAKNLLIAEVDAFWIVVGAVFVVGGISELVSFRIDLVPVVCIVAGATLLASALFRRHTV